MKKIIQNTKKVIEALRTKNGDDFVYPEIEERIIFDPDAEVLISKEILNDFLTRNFPFSTKINLDEKRQVDISVSSAVLQFEQGNVVQLQITNAGIRSEKMNFNIGLQSNIVILQLNIGIIKEDNDFRLVISGGFSTFDVKFMPKWLEKRIVDYLRTKLFSPLLDRSITEFIGISKELNTEYGAIKLNLQPEDAAIKIDKNGVRLQVKYLKASKTHLLGH